MVEIQPFLIQNTNVVLSVETITLIFASFSCIRRVQINDQFISNQIQEVNHQRAKFIRFCDGSKSLNNALETYSKYILSTVSILDGNTTREELVSRLINSLLPLAIRNKLESENYVKQIKKIKRKLTEIQYKLYEYSVEIDNGLKSIEEELRSTKKKKEDLKISRKRVVVAGFVITGAAAIATVTGGAAIVGVAAAVDFVEVTLGMSMFATEISTLVSALLTAAAGCGTHKKSSSLNEKIKTNDNRIINLNANLTGEREQLIQVIKMIDDELKHIVMNMSEIVTLWEDQVFSLKENIKLLEKGELNPNLNKFDISDISDNAKEIKELACKYHRLVNLII
ncbi:hypothetical protein Glove_578g46 [Diversispora epigaea]|uniref:Uncharacterized protein n=1 Tax=Diversispora epigaea TaxID=1348612 RepID=A0A397G960_9GLOM|nr:hypothetical protein Glove_578g46 [Diversispora epigaea]